MNQKIYISGNINDTCKQLESKKQSKGKSKKYGTEE